LVSPSCWAARVKFPSRTTTAKRTMSAGTLMTVRLGLTLYPVNPSLSRGGLAGTFVP
jgi:hypothetical protein